MKTEMELVDLSPQKSLFRIDILDGLRALRKKTPPKYLYDERGSRLFEQICDLEEYYPYRAELEVLRDHADTIVRRIGPGSLLLEFGSGASVKTCSLLDRLQGPLTYVPIDISRTALLASTRRIRAQYSNVEVHPICSDFTAELRFPPGFFDGAEKRVAFFPGSTIGNFEPAEARLFLSRTARLLGAGGLLLVGVDLLKSRVVLEAAYNDSQGVTAQFNLNLLRRINEELDGHFKPETFRHLASLNSAHSRVEMHLVSLEAQEVRIGETRIRFRQGESIHTENSYKYEPVLFESLAVMAGYEVAEYWAHPDWNYRIYCLSVASEGNE